MDQIRHDQASSTLEVVPTIGILQLSNSFETTQRLVKQQADKDKNTLASQ
jgi:hypothetical protein